MSQLKIILIAIGVIAFATISHLALAAQDTHGVWRQIAAFMLTVPVFAVTCWSCIKLLQRMGAAKALQRLCCILLIVAAVYLELVFRPLMLAHLDYMYLAEHVSTNAMLCWFFAHTLVGERSSLVTMLASATHGWMPERIILYTRRVTMAWALFFATQACLSLLIFYFASIATWSWFANVLNWPLVALMFVVEYACRKHLNPDFPHSTIKQSVSAYLNNRHKI